MKDDAVEAIEGSLFLNRSGSDRRWRDSRVRAGGDSSRHRSFSVVDGCVHPRSVPHEARKSYHRPQTAMTRRLEGEGTHGYCSK